MRRYTGQPYVVACSSGTAALHLGLIAYGLGPGDEVVCTPNTDAGTVIGILAEGAVPVFCDVAETLQPTPRAIRAVLTPRTRAVIVVHLAGYPAPVDAIVRLAPPEESPFSYPRNRGRYSQGLSLLRALRRRPSLRFPDLRFGGSFFILRGKRRRDQRAGAAALLAPALRDDGPP